MKSPIYIQLYFGFMMIAVPLYSHAYGIRNFLYICDVALFVNLAAFLVADKSKDQSARLLSATLCGMLVPQGMWVIDFIQCILLGCSSSNSLSGYMFSSELPLYIRAISSFHIWQPFFLLYCIKQIGYYHPDGWITWSKIAALDLLLSYMLSTPPGGPSYLPRNVNKVYGMDDDKAQTLVHPWLWLALLIVSGPILVYYPSHLLIQTIIEPLLFSSSTFKQT